MITAVHDTEDRSITDRARKRVAMKLGFYMHLLVYVCVNAGLMLLNAVQGGHRWSVWPLMGWGLGLAIHGLVTFASLRGEGVRERMLASEIERLKKSGR
jgi:2TM domain